MNTTYYEQFCNDKSHTLKQIMLLSFYMIKVTTSLKLDRRMR